MKRRALIGRGAGALALLATGSVVTGAWSCAGGSGSTDDFRAKLIGSWGDALIMPGFAAFAAEAATLRGAIDAFCESPDAAGLSAAQNQWMVARGAWKVLEAFRFGPYSAVPERLGPKIDFWPARPDSIEEVLADSAPLTVDGMDSYGAATRGLPVIEYLLFEPGADTLTAFSDDARRCEYLAALGGDLENLAQAIHDAWSPSIGGFLLELTQPPGGEAMYMDTQQAISELVNRMWFTVENIRRDKLGRPLGNETNGSPQPDKVESPHADRSLDDIRDNLTMLDKMFEGSEGLGLVDHPRVSAQPATLAAFRDGMVASLAALDAINKPLDEAVFGDGADVQAAIDALAELQRSIQVDLIAALALNIAFNDSDGD